MKLNEQDVWKVQFLSSSIFEMVCTSFIQDADLVFIPQNEQRMNE